MLEEWWLILYSVSYTVFWMNLVLISLFMTVCPSPGLSTIGRCSRSQVNVPVWQWHTALFPF